MSLRLIALVYCATLKFAKKPLVFLLLVLTCPVHSQSPSSNEDLKKQADNLFQEEDYNRAYKLYSQLVSNFPKDPVYNYKLGVCMIFSEPDKKKSLPYLKFAAANSENNKELKDVRFYLGKAYHINYLFDEAIKNYNDYKLTASSTELKKLQVDREIKACSNGKHLLSNLTDLEVISKSELSENDYFRSYKKIGGKLLVKPEEFKTSADKKKKEKSVVFLPNGSDVVYFSSYGDNGENGKDLYTSAKQADGTYSKPQKVKGVNTEFDEDYPFLHPDGKTLYFASKGHNSMGGYDIFKSVFNGETNTWGLPFNMEFPINSPDDDYLFVTDSLETMAYFSTGRQSPPGKIDVLKVKTKRRPIDIIAMKGNVIQGNPEYSLKSTITVKDLFSQNDVGSYNSEEDGSYSMELPNGGKLLFTVETPGLETQSAQVSIPLASAAKPFKQTISYDKGKLKILNYFDVKENDDSYLQYLNVIEKKAKLEVNEVTVETSPLAVNSANPEATKNPKDVNKDKKPTIVSTEPGETPAADPKKGLDNKQLAKMARQDAEESKQEAAQLNRDFIAANETGLKQKEEADRKAAEASDAILKAESITDDSEKKVAIEAATALKLSAESDQAIATKIIQLAKSLDEDAKTKEKEAELNSEYAKELENSMRIKNNKASLAKLDALQKEISELSVKKNVSEGVVSEIKTDIEQKEKQIADAEQVNITIKANIEEIKTAITDKESELEKTKKKSAKKEIGVQIEELKTEQEEKIKQVAANETEIKTLNEELAATKSQLDIATKITAENIAVNANTPPQPVTIKSLEEKYRDKTVIIDPESRSSVEESSTQLTKYTRDLDQLISKNKAELVKSKNKDTKLKLSNEIKQAEASKKQNQQQIAGNTKKLEELSKIAAKAPESVKTTFDPITASTSSEAVTKLDNLNAQLAGNDNENFDYNGYQNPKAQSLKIEADARINDAVAKQKKLKDDIAISKEEIKKSSPVLTNLQLIKEAENLLAQSQKIKEEANTKKGSEKENFLNSAKKLEEQGNAKYIDAAEITRSDNVAIIEANEENIRSLIAENKSGEEDLNFAKTLNEESKAAFRKAVDIRTEGNSLSNAGGKLGSFSNAEEKEAEAIQKQQQALAVLVKSNPEFQLKVPVTSASAPSDTNSAGSSDLSSKLEAVNTGLTDLAAVKIESYQKLNEANEVEIAQLLSDIKDNQATIDKTPSIKTDFISTNNKVESAKTLKQNADNAANPNEKLSNLIASIKKQTESIKQLNSINTSISQTVAGSNANAATSTATVQNEQPIVTENINLPLTENTNTAVTETQAPPDNELSKLSEIGTEIVDVTTLAQKDTTTDQIIAYFDNNNLYMRNDQAGSTAKRSLNLLKDYEVQNSNLNNELTKFAKSSENTEVAPANIKELDDKANLLVGEAEELNEDSQDFKKEAQSKPEGEEKNYTLAQARDLEIKAQDKMLEASTYKQQANETEYKTNINAINELIAKLKTDNPDMASEMESRREEYTPLKTQIGNLRAEANALNNKAAKLGAISNAEEKEIELIQKQTSLLNELKRKYPDYVVKQMEASSPVEQRAELEQKKLKLREKQYSELTNLTNAFSLEYESSKNNVPPNLSSDQQTVKQNADLLNTESKRLLIQASQEKNENEKIKLLTLSAKSGNAAIEKLNKLLPKSNSRPKSDLDELAKLGNEIENSNAEPAVTNRNTNSGAKSGRGTIKIEGLEVVQGNAYSTANPIPMDAQMEDGLVFRVQIGAFKTQLPNNAFKGLSPLNGETTNNGYIRYTAGNFFKIENANAVKNDLRNLGYSDAFVVVYFNGKRISLAEALAEMEKQGKTVDPNAPQTAGITANVNVPKAAVNTAIQESVTVTKELDKIDGLLYTIQIGVFTRQVSKPQILSLRPIFREQLPNGLYRYTAGIYINPDKLLLDKNKVVDMGIRDAFVSAYLNGKRIPFAEAKERQASDATLKLEPENPIVFPDRNAAPPAPAATNPFDALLNTPVNVEPFRNSVTNYPTPTPENGVKTNEEGVSFKVQIGAFSKQVPEDVAAKFASIRSWPVDNKQINGLFIYNIGNFSDAKFAKELKNEAIRLGITDAFISVYKDGRKLYGAEAEGYLR